MKKRNIIIGILVVLIIAVMIAIVVYNNTINTNNNEIVNNNEQNLGEVQTIEEGNIFLAKVITNEQNKIIVVPNDNELIYQSFKILNVIISGDSTVITKKDTATAKIEDIAKGQTVKIEFDGKILSTNPTNIIAKNIEIQ